MGAILPPKPLVTGELGGGGKHFLNIYPKWSLHTKFQLLSTKIEGLSLDGGNFTPKKPRYGGERGGGGKHFLNLYPKLGLHTKFQLPSTKTVSRNPPPCMNFLMEPAPFPSHFAKNELPCQVSKFWGQNCGLGCSSFKIFVPLFRK